MIKTIVLFVCAYVSTVSLAETHYVTASGYQFSPDVLYINAGDTIQWNYVSGLPHTVTTGTNCLWDQYFHASLASFNPVVIWVVPIDAPSEIPYFCLPHCNDGMTAMIYVTHVCVADINGDDVVDVVDLLAVLDAWGTNNELADVNGDGAVNVTDLLAVVGNWGSCQ